MRTTTVTIALFLWFASATAAQVAAPPASTLGPRTLTAAMVACTDAPTTAPLATDLRVLGLHNGDRRLNAARGDLVVLNGGTPAGLAIGQQYFTRRRMSPIDYGPITAANPAVVVTSGWLTVVAADARFAVARIDHSCLAVETGDYLEPFALPELPGTVGDAGKTDFSQLGRVLFGMTRRITFGAGDLLSIDWGRSKGIVAGTRVAFYRDRRNGTPLAHVGDGIVVDAAAETAMVVLDRTTLEVRSGDYFAVNAIK